MGKSELFRKYYNRLALIGCGKSAVLALIAAFIADFVAAIIVFAAKASLSTVLIVCLGTFGAVFVISLPLYYFSYFRPTTAMIARLLDGLGLEERIVTMCEFEKDDSYIAMIQREDAKNKLKSVNAKNLRFNISRVAAILLAISFCLGTSMTAFSVYASMLPDKPGSSVSGSEDGENGKDKDENGEDGEDENEDPAEEEDPLAEYVTVTYLVKDDIGGHIQGDTVQKIKKGSDAKPVKAIADEGYEFYVWSDDYIYSERYDWEVMEDLTVEAIFVPEEESADGEGEGDENSGDDAGHGSAGDKNNQGGQGGQGLGGLGEHGQSKPDNSGGHGQAASGQGAGNQGQGGLGNIGGDGLGVEGGGGEGEGLGAEGGGEGEGEGGDANGDGKGGEGEGDGEGGEGQGQGEGQGSGNGSGNGSGEGDGNGNGSGSATDPGNASSGIGEGEPPIGDGHLETDYVGGGDNNNNGQGSTGNVEDGYWNGESQKNNTVIDGNTSYQEGMGGESSQENLQNDQSIPPELKDLIDKYLNGLKP